MKLIILAAGQGTRLRPMTDDRPKVLVVLDNRTILEWQLDAAEAAGIEEIVVVGGYRADRLHPFDVDLVINKKYATTNMVQSLFCARDHFDDDFIMAYGDIVYQHAVLKKLLNSPNAISVVVDSDWRSYWETRFEDPLADAESLDMDEQGFITSIGQKVADIDEIQAQYIGLVRFSGVGVHHLCEVFDEAESNGLLNHMTGQMLDVNQLYMTDILQAIAFRNKSLKAVEIDGNWLEIDNINDLEIAEATVKGGKLNRRRGR